jgi:MFS superfamily sulfate permease-like transporter/ActR/RegA family two-component response regulator
MFSSLLKRIFPFIDWFRGYKIGSFRADLVAGLTVALVLIPQSMAYAQLAGLPAYYGLYAALLPPMVASLFGSSRQLATGPVAIVSLMTSATLEPLATASSEGYIAYAVLLALLVGIFQFSLGLFRLGVVVNFLSHPVVIGFTNAAAIIIATSQLYKLFGVIEKKGEHHYETVWNVVVAAVHFFHWPTFLLALLAFAVMIVIKRLNPRIPYVLLAVIVTTVISWAVGFEHNESVATDDIKDPELPALVDTFNSRLNEIATISEVRTALNVDVEKNEGAHDSTCTSCHLEHHVTLDMLRKGSAEGAAIKRDVIPKTALELHLKAGLLSQLISRMKEEASEAKDALVSLHYEAVKESDGRLHFYPRGKVPGGMKGDERTWRIKVGNTPIDPSVIPLVGGGTVVGVVPKGLPSVSLPAWDWSIVFKLIIAAIIISILGFMEAISIAKAMAARTGQRLDPNQELIGQGLANMLGSFTQSYAVSGSFSRSAVNIQAGAVSGLSSVVTSAVVIVVLLLLTPLLYHLPQSVLAAVIMMAVLGLINLKGIVHAWRVQKSDGIISVVTFVATLYFAPHLDRGILLGVVLSVGVFLYRKMKPAISELSLWRDGHLRSARHFKLRQCRHIAVVRFEGPLFFANTSYLEDEILERVRSMPELKFILFESHGINEIDASGEEALSLLIDRLRSGGYDVYFTGLTENVLNVLHRSHLFSKIGEDHIFPTSATALEIIWERAHEGSSETDCPLLAVMPIAEEEAKPEAYRIRVLVVDANKKFADTVAGYLPTENIEAEACYDSREALRRTAVKPFDVALLDVSLLDGSATPVIRQLLVANPRLQILMLAEAGSIASAETGMRLGAVGFLVKPCPMDSIAGKILHAFKHRELDHMP